MEVGLPLIGGGVDICVRPGLSIPSGVGKDCFCDHDERQVVVQSQGRLKLDVHQQLASCWKQAAISGLRWMHLPP